MAGNETLSLSREIRLPHFQPSRQNSMSVAIGTHAFPECLSSFFNTEDGDWEYDKNTSILLAFC